MKKVIVMIFILFIILFISREDDFNITDDSIRFRVIANSDSPRDIQIKEMVVSELSSILFKDNEIDDMRNDIINNLSLIEEKVDSLFINNNYDKTYNILYGMNEFPKKEYNGVVYEEGLYESLVIEIGEGKGSNYWCFLYPSLCMIDYEKLDNNVKYKSKIKELLDNLF